MNICMEVKRESESLECSCQYVLMTKPKWFYWLITYILGASDLEIKQIGNEDLN